MKLDRIMLKLSGEALAGEKKTGFDEATVLAIAEQVKKVSALGKEIGIVIGGGNFWRGRSSENMDRTKADQIGMLATIMNCIYVSEMFRSVGLSTEILTPFACGSMTKLFSKDLANECFKQGKIVFFAGGTGHPYFSTDTGIVQVDQNGVITTVGPGTADVFVISNNSSVEASCTVHSLAMSTSRVRLEQYDRFNLDVIGTEDAVTWRSSNPRVCTVSSSGEVIGRRAGTATVTATVHNKTLSCTVTVTNIR